MSKRSGVTVVRESNTDRAKRLKKVTDKRMDFLISLETTRFIFPSYCAIPKETTVIYHETMSKLLEHFALTFAADKLQLLRYTMESFFCRYVIDSATMGSLLREKEFYSDYFKIVPVNALSEITYGDRIIYVYDNTMLVSKKGYIMENIDKLRRKSEK